MYTYLLFFPPIHGDRRLKIFIAHENGHAYISHGNLFSKHYQISDFVQKYYKIK